MIPSGQIRTILDREYGIKMGKVQKKAQGLGNFLFFVSSSLGKIIIRVPKNNSSQLSQLILEAAVSDLLWEKGIPVRRVIKTPAGEVGVTAEDGQLLTVFRFVAGEYPLAIKAAHLQEVGVVLSQLHTILANFEGRGQLIHGDFNPGNFLFTGDKISAVLDLEHTRYGEIYEDLATGLVHYCYLLEGKWRPLEILKSVGEGYGLSEEQQARVIQEVAVVQKKMVGWPPLAINF